MLRLLNKPLSALAPRALDSRTAISGEKPRLPITGSERRWERAYSLSVACGERCGLSAQNRLPAISAAICLLFGQMALFAEQQISNQTLRSQRSPRAWASLMSVWRKLVAEQTFHCQVEATGRRSDAEVRRE